jgi:probable phosphoglycerate mutase
MNEILFSDQKDLVIVTHGFAATFVISCWIGLPIESADYVAFSVSPASLSLLVEDDVFLNRGVIRLNDRSHLH